MKLLGAVMLTLAGLAWGLGRAKGLKDRVAALGEWRRLMLHLRTEILYAARPVGESIALDPGPFGSRARGWADPLDGLEAAGEELLGDAEDRELFRRFLGGLGASGARGQEEHFQLYGELLEQRLQEARAEWREKSRVFVAVGVFAGMAAAVVML